MWLASESLAAPLLLLIRLYNLAGETPHPSGCLLHQPGLVPPPPDPQLRPPPGNSAQHQVISKAPWHSSTYTDASCLWNHQAGKALLGSAYLHVCSSKSSSSDGVLGSLC
jgi:hypothetical protein